MSDEPYLVIEWPNATDADKALAVEIAQALFREAGTTAPNAAIAAWTLEGEELDVPVEAVQLTEADRKAAVVWHDLDETIAAAFGWKPTEIPDLDIRIEPWASEALTEVETLRAQIAADPGTKRHLVS